MAYKLFRVLRLGLVMNLLITELHSQPRSGDEIDVCVYGGTSAGVIAAYTAAKMGKSVVLIEPGKRLGGLSSGGLGFTDIGNKYVVTGLAHDFYRRLGQHYGKFEQWIFEPKVAEAIFLGYVKRAGIKVIYDHRLNNVIKDGTVVLRIALESSTGKPGLVNIHARQFIDCSYEGDLMAKAGVSYTTGRESNSLYGETVNGVQLKHEHQFPDGIDPYRIPGKPGSGLLWGISDAKLAASGTGDKKIQAYNYRICLSNDPANRLEITKPANYDPDKYELLLRYLVAKPGKDLWAFLKMSPMPNHKTDINNNGPFSTDMIGMNYDYPEADYKTREKIIAAHEDYTKGLLYFAGHDLRMPEHLRKQMLAWGYPKDEYTTTGNFTPQLYVREARRMLGAYVMTQANCEGKEIVTDGIGMGAYNMDSHNVQRIVVNGMVKNEGDVQLRGISPYPVAYRSITPKVNECTNLLVPVCLSASHMAYGSIRMEPVFMVLAQSAAVAAVQAIDKQIAVQQIDLSELQNELKRNPLADHSLPEILVDNDDAEQVSIAGDWKKEKAGAYGLSYLKTNSRSGSVKFSPDVHREGSYHIYIYCPKIAGAADKTSIQIFDGRQIKKLEVHKEQIQVTGQTSGEWISLGLSDLSKGKNSYVEVISADADGLVVADAVLFVPQNH